MFDRIEDLKIGTVSYVFSLDCLVVITGVTETKYECINSYGVPILIDKTEKMSFDSKYLRRDNTHFLDMNLYGITLENEEDAKKKLKEAEEDKVKYLQRIKDNPPEFR